MKWNLFFALVLGALPAYSMDFALEGGLRSQNAEYAAYDTQTEMGVQVGATALFQFHEQLYLRTGMLYTQRPLAVDNLSGTGSTKISMNYLDVPLTLLYKFEDYAGIFAGVNMGILFDKSPSSAVTKAQSFLFPVTFGARFMITPQIGASIYFESAMGDSSEAISNAKALGMNLLVTFE